MVFLNTVFLNLIPFSQLTEHNKYASFLEKEAFLKQIVNN